MGSVNAVTALIVAGFAVAIGLVLIVRGLAGDGQEPTAAPSRLDAWREKLAEPKMVRRLGISFGAAVLAGVFTGWPAAALLAGGVAWFAPSLMGRDTSTKTEVARIEAIASWAELLRDTLSAAAGLEQSILASATAVPAPIREQVQSLAGRLRAGATMEESLKAFAAELADPTADLIIAALLLASRSQARNLPEVLGSLAEATRAQAALRLRTAADRARTRTSVRMITAVVMAMAFGLIMLNRSFLAPYDTPTGQLVLLLVASLFGSALMWLNKMGAGKAPARFLTRLDGPAAAASRRGRR
ncbi:type II secretion system F family protein [Catenulispora subtropica]|uniref:Type II secretion system F family protein n=1 Tax=Catenulispora subtropica TaxID=450798 RepID=A0ABN2T880_9ACTN